MQIDRLFRIVHILLENDMITAMDLSKTLEVSVRTVYRDIETLSVSGIPIYAVVGKGGGYRLLENFVLNKSAITEKEQGHILMGLQNLSAAGHVDIQNTFSKLSTLFDKKEPSWIEVDYSRWGVGDGADQNKFDQLKDAIISHNVISFSYFNNYGDHTVRTVEPLKLIFKSKSWYLQGFCCEKQEYRTFKINRISGLESLSERYTNQHNDIPPIDRADSGGGGELSNYYTEI